MTQEASWPTRPTLTSFGEALLERLAPLIPHEIGADLINLIRWTLAGSARVGPLATLYVDSAGVTVFEENAWHGAVVASAKTGTGLYTITAPGTVTDNRGQTVAVALTCAVVSCKNAAARIATWDVIDVDELRVSTFDAAGVAADSAFTITIW